MLARLGRQQRLQHRLGPLRTPLAERQTGLGQTQGGEGVGIAADIQAIQVPLQLQAGPLRFVGTVQPQQETHLAAHRQGVDTLVTGALHIEQPFLQFRQPLLRLPGIEARAHHDQPGPVDQFNGGGHVAPGGGQGQFGQDGGVAILFVEQIGIGQGQRPANPAAPAEHPLDPLARRLGDGATAFQLAIFLADQGFDQTGHHVQVGAVHLAQLGTRQRDGLAGLGKVAEQGQGGGLHAGQAGAKHGLVARHQRQPLAGNLQAGFQLVLIQEHQGLEHLGGTQQFDQPGLGRLAPPLQKAAADLLDQGLGFGEALIEGQLPGVEQLKDRVLANLIGGHLLEQAQHPVGAVAGHQPGTPTFQQVGGQGEVPSAQGVGDGAVAMSLRLAPAGGGQQQRCRAAVARQAPLQEFGEQVVVTEPLALAIQRNDEQLLPLQTGQDLGTVRASGQGVTQLGAELVKHRGLLQEATQRRRQTGQHILGQVIRDVALAARQPADEGLVVGVARQGQGRQMQGGDPALGTLIQQVQLLFGQRQVAQAIEVFGRLGPVQTQLRGADQQAGAVRQCRFLTQEAGHEAAAGDQVQTWRQPAQQVAYGLGEIRVTDAMHIVEKQIDLAGKALHIGQKGIQQGFHGPVRPVAQQRTGVAAETGLRQLQRRQHILEQPLWLTVGLVAGHPGHARAGAVQALTQQGQHRALAVTGRRGKQQQRTMTRIEKPVDQRLASKQLPLPQRGRKQLAAQQRRPNGSALFEMVHVSTPRSRARRIAWVRLRTRNFS